jgi:hypothetical protein
VATCADDNRRFDLLIGHPPVTPPRERDERPIVEHTHLRPAQEKVVELASPDGVADDVRIPGLDDGLAQDACPEAGNLLQDKTGRAVVLRLEIERAEDAWCHPAAADLVAWKTGAIEHDDVPPSKAQCTCAARTSGSAADD